MGQQMVDEEKAAQPDARRNSMIQHVVFHVGPTVHEAAITARPIEFQPLKAIGWALHAMMDTPCTG